MNYSLINLSDIDCAESDLFIEGVVLAANFATRPLDPEHWLPELFAEQYQALLQPVTEQIHLQYQQLKANGYDLLALLAENASSREQGLADFAEGFMQLWPQVESMWQQGAFSDGSIRMLQALLTTFMLAIDEEQTQAQMREAGYEQVPALADLIEQLNLMVHEVALAADEAMLGAKTQSVNPFKGIGRNDACPCDSGKKFKQCCGQ
ncbi:YecA family protein [Vibrio mimicus]|uniref:YecA family protein n=1 Tax=Vibrio mimicus TaxID=674 RepID=UPI0001BAC802|nr:YecA family protein [Vibrio mimicus]EEY38920.1 protein export cytoplasm protein SecA ATPase RNA helicase [Vibrio mimicus MB451]ERM58688.1 prepilin peptidase [Vibrio mimicus CAIM 1882]ERM59702.1 prepilin peptidase [Vibrio mimicus CAIM 1883]TXY47253.1 YecA family protein [Vibrio mimicus]